jgi:hypothetical protein
MQRVTDGLSVSLELAGSRADVMAVQLTVPLDGWPGAAPEVRFSLPSDWVASYHQVGGELRISMAGVTPLRNGTIAHVTLAGADQPLAGGLGGMGQVNENAARRIEAAR